MRKALKKTALLLMFLILATGTTAFGAEKEEWANTAVSTEWGQVLFRVQREVHRLDCQCQKELKIEMEFPAEMGQAEGSLYLQLRDSENISFSEEKKELAIPLEEMKQGRIKRKAEIQVTEDIMYGERASLWLVGGEGYENNLWQGQEDLLLQENVILFLQNAYEIPTGHRIQHIYFGADREDAWVNAQFCTVKPAPYINEEGYFMVPLRELNLLVPTDVVWHSATQSATVYNFNTIYMKLGDKTWYRNGEARQFETAPEWKEGRIFVPVSGMAEMVNTLQMQWLPEKRTIYFETEYPV